MKIEQVAIFIRVDGRTTLAPIDPQIAEAFVQMLSAFQTGSPKETKLVVLPKRIVKKLGDLTDALAQEIALREQAKAQKGGAA